MSRAEDKPAPRQYLTPTSPETVFRASPSNWAGAFRQATVVITQHANGFYITSLLMKVNEPIPVHENGSFKLGRFHFAVTRGSCEDFGLYVLNADTSAVLSDESRLKNYEEIRDSRVELMRSSAKHLKSILEINVVDELGHRLIVYRASPMDKPFAKSEITLSILERLAE